MKLTGGSCIAGEVLTGEVPVFYAVNPANGEQLGPAFIEGTAAQVDCAAQLAERDFGQFRQLSLVKRADFLTTITEQLRTLESDLIARAHLETALPIARLEGELTRTVNQLLLFADLVRAGDFLQPQIDPALPDRQPLPRPDLRMTQVPLGPVAVFGASNFPFAFSVAGGDTAAAFAAGCPVIVKGHPAHPGTCELAGQAITNAIEKCGVPKGTFSLLQGSRHQLGAALVQQPLVQAVAFTGSHAGGRALFDLAAARPAPIPVYAEMGSINPIFVLPQSLAEGADLLAQNYADSVTLGVGQFCTNPGVMFVLNSPELEAFMAELVSCLGKSGKGLMLHAGIRQNFQARLTALAERPGVEQLRGELVETAESGDCQVSAALLRTTADRFLADPQMAEEVFGPSALLVVCYSFLQMQQCAAALQGQLTATVMATAEEETLCRELFSVLERKAGRLILNGFPTGVEVCQAMIHGGPYPATTDSRTTSVGTNAIQRFLRPVCLQNFSASLLPEHLR